MENEKGNAGNIALDNLEHELTMNNNTPTQNKFQFYSRRELLESAKLSRLPERKSFNLPDIPSQKPPAVSCVGCGGRLDADDKVQQSIKVCRKCLAHYAKIDFAIDEASKRKRRGLLEKFAAEVKR